MERYCYYCGKKIKYKSREYFCSPDHYKEHTRQINREKQREFYKKHK